MENAKIIKLLRKDCKFQKLKSLEKCKYADNYILKIEYIKEDNYDSYFHPYFSIKPYENEALQYKELLKDIECKHDLEIFLDKRILPTNFDIDLLFSSQEVNSLKEISCRYLIFDISGYFPGSKDFSKHYFNFLHLFLTIKSLSSIIIITRPRDKDILLIFRKEQFSPIFKRIQEEKRSFIIVSEDGKAFIKGERRPRKVKEFLYQHLKFVLSKQEYKYYGHFEVSSGVHAQIFQDFYKLIPDYEDILFNYLGQLLKERKSVYNFDTIISFAFPQNPFSHLGGRLKQSLKIQHIGIDKSLEINRAIEGQNIKEVVLLTDVVYSGNTAREIIGKFKSRGVKIQELIVLSTDHEKYPLNLNNIPIRVLVQSHLPWWNPKMENCPLCKYRVHPMKGKNEHINKRIEVRKVLNPFEFYYFVDMSNALEIVPRKTLKRNCYKFYFNTSSLFHKFGLHIARMLVEKLSNKIILSEIDVIICPEDLNMSSIFLSLLFSAVLKTKIQKPIPVILINRRKITAWKDFKTGSFYESRELYNKSVLIIDDGINTLTTFNNLQRLCASINVNKIIGISVFLNRSFCELAKDMEYQADKWWLYLWPSPPFKEDEFPYQLENE